MTDILERLAAWVDPSILPGEYVAVRADLIADAYTEIKQLRDRQRINASDVDPTAGLDSNLGYVGDK